MIDETSIAAGETVFVAVRVRNVADRPADYRANLTVDGERVDSKSVTVDGRRSATLLFERRFDYPGEYDVAVGGVSLGTLTVSATTDRSVSPEVSGDGDGSSPVRVVDATVGADWVREGYETTARATVVNAGNRSATQTLTVTVDDRPVANATVRLPPNTRETVSIDFRAADGTVAVEGVGAGRIVVGETYWGGATVTANGAGGAASGLDFGLGVGGFLRLGLVAVAVGAVVLLAGEAVRVTRRGR